MSLDWDRLHTFYEVARGCNIKEGAQRLNLSQSAVSRQISDLERRSDLKLFHRHARGILLTEQGEILYKAVEKVFNTLKVTEAQLEQTRDKPQGILTLTTPRSFGTEWLMPRIKRFRSLYPDIQLRIYLKDGELDLGMREADVAIVFGKPQHTDVIQRQIMTVDHGIYASKNYLRNHGRPEHEADLDHHNLIGFGNWEKPYSEVDWLLSLGQSRGARREPAMRVNGIKAIYNAVLADQGIATIPGYIIDPHDPIERILPQCQGPVLPAYFLYAEELRNSKKIQVLRDYIIEEMQDIKPDPD